MKSNICVKPVLLPCFLYITECLKPQFSLKTGEIAGDEQPAALSSCGNDVNKAVRTNRASWNKSE